MAVGLEPWIYTLRSYCASAVFVTLLFAAPILSSFGVADAKSYKHPSGFRPLLVSLFLLYLGDIAVLVIEAQSRGELPDAVASISMSIFAFTSAVQLEKLATLEKVQFSVSCIYLGSWFLLFTVEFFTIIWLWSRPSAALFPYPQFGIVFTAVELLAYIALSSLFYHACCERYESLTQSDIENAASESTGYGGDDDESEWDSNGCKADPLGIRMEVRKEVGELGGWWPFIKKFRIFLEFMWPFDNALLQLRFILTLFFVMAGRVISVYQPLQTALLLDALASGTDPWRPLAVVITIDFADTVCSFIVKLLWIDVGLHRDEKLKVKVQSHIMSLDFSFHSQAQPTDVIKAVDNAGSVDTLLDSFIFEFWMNLVTLVVAIVQMFHRYGLYVVLVCSHTALYYCIVEKQYVTVAAAEHDKCNTLRDEQERRRQGSVRGWSTVSNHNQANYETGFFSSAVRSWMSQRRRYQMICYGFNATQSAILFLGFATCFAFVIYKVQSGEGPIGDLVAFTGLWGFLLSPIDYFTSIVSDMIEDLLDTARLRRILEWEPSTQKGDQNLKCDTGKIEFQGVSFSYPGSNRLIIDNLSMVIEGGSTVAFVGPSGSGKSTMCNLLMGNLTPTAGTIFIDDQDIRTLKKDSLRDHIAMMSQNPYIFNSTVLYNVKYANLGATDEEIYEACRKAGIHETIISRKGGYNTLMGEDGQNFSGGERQRILLSRLFLNKTAKVKLIDEGTSALDAETEAGIKQSIEEGLADETVILVAHRLSSVRHADLIFVFGTNGKIMESGTHDELVAKDGEYAKLWKMHIGEKIGGDTGDLIDVSA